MQVHELHNLPDLICRVSWSPKSRAVHWSCRLELRRLSNFMIVYLLLFFKKKNGGVLHIIGRLGGAFVQEEWTTVTATVWLTPYFRLVTDPFVFGSSTTGKGRKKKPTEFSFFLVESFLALVVTSLASSICKHFFQKFKWNFRMSARYARWTPHSLERFLLHQMLDMWRTGKSV